MEDRAVNLQFTMITSYAPGMKRCFSSVRVSSIHRAGSVGPPNRLRDPARGCHRRTGLGEMLTSLSRLQTKNSDIVKLGLETGEPNFSMLGEFAANLAPEKVRRLPISRTARDFLDDADKRSEG